MGRLNGRVTRLEKQVNPTERPAVVIFSDLVLDMNTGKPFTGELETAVILAHVDARYDAI